MSDWNVTLREPEGGSNIAAGEVLELLASLVDKNLVVGEGDRYRMLETMRQYGRGRLNDTGEAESIRALHAACFLALAEEAEPHLTGSDQRSWLERLDSEHDNLRAALEWSLMDKDEGGRQKDDTGAPNAIHPSSLIPRPSELGLRLGGVACRFWYVRGHFGEGRRRLSLALERPGAEGHCSERAKALTGAGNLANRQGDYMAARVLYEESLEIRRELADRDGIAGSLNNLGNVAHDEGDYPAARALFEESLVICRELGDRNGIAGSLGNLGNVASDEGDYPAARALLEASVAMMRELGDRHGIAVSLNNLGNVAYAEGDYPAARGLYAESLAIRTELGDRHGIAYSLEGLGRLAWAAGSPGRAARLWEASESLREAIGAPLAPVDQATHDRERAAVRDALGEAAFDSAFNEGRAMT